MGGRRKSSTAEDLMDLVALLPWWAGVGLALVSHWMLHDVADRPIQAMQPGHAGEQVSAMLWQGLAMGGQYLLPLIFLMGALASVVRRQKRNALFNAASAGSSADVLQGMSWQEFELLVGEGFKRRGYRVRETGGGGADGGVDLVLTKAGEKSFVQCKQWKAYKVGVTTVRELYGVMAAEGAANGFVVTSGRFTTEADAFAAGRNIQLMDGAALMQLLRDGRANQTTGPETVSPGLSSDFDEPPRRRAAMRPSPATPSFEAAAEPSCPRCAKPMVRRIAKKGPAAGKGFWGCSDYSGGCRGTREI